MESAQKRERDRKQRQRRQEKEDRRKERAAQKLLRRTTPAPLPGSPGESSAAPEAGGAPATGGPEPV
jgi:hypothetical protein